MNKIIILLLVMLIASCSKSVDIQLEPEAEIFVSPGSDQIFITQKDEVYVALNKWLHENSSGWYATSGRYPGGVYIKSGEYGIQVLESKVIIYSTTSTESKALYIKEIKKGSLNHIVNFDSNKS